MTTTISGSNGIVFPDATSMQTGQQAVKAWVNFDGTGTVAIRAGYNVSSITDAATGQFTINFTTAMVDANYSAVFIAGSSGTGITSDLAGASEFTTTGVAIRTRIAGTSNVTNADVICASIFR